MIIINSDDVKRHIKDVYNEIRTYMISDSGFEPLTRSYVAGGCFVSLVNNEKVEDYDIWFRDVADFEKVVASFSQSRISKESRFATTVKINDKKIQFVKSRVGEPQKVVSTFDFKHTHSFCTYDGNLSINMWYLRSKKLEYVKGNYDHIVNTVQRVLKFVRRGYWIENDNLRELLLDVSKCANESIANNVAFY